MEDDKEDGRPKEDSTHEGNEDQRNSTVLIGGRKVTSLEQTNMRDFRRVLDVPVDCSRIRRWLASLPENQREAEIEMLSELGAACERIADENETFGDLIGSLANPAGVIGAAAFGAVAFGAAPLTSFVAACIAAGAVVYIGGHVYKFVTGRAAKKGRRVSKYARDIAGAQDGKSWDERK
jgi:hypothetical protein